MEEPLSPVSEAETMYAHEIPRLEADFERITEDIRQKNLRLQRVLDVNRTLYSSIAAKQKSIREIQERKRAVTQKINCRSIEADGRVAQLQQVQQSSQTAHGVHKIAHQRASELMGKSEGEVKRVNKENILFAEEHVDLSNVLQDQEARLDDMDKRIIHSTARLQTLVEMLSVASGTDFGNLPGVPIAKLLREAKDTEERKRHEKEIRERSGERAREAHAREQSSMSP
jgi:PAS domain-containing protein